ncbi:MAG TPA: [FeFe] hydrogenase H-cluster radical SAM maturase HydE [Phycisphaerae bacterium]|nr:[FeFe] hydrogenase H-cluster radical SAM maturase HydE [Phycisphaerae bacterium]
MDRKELLTWLRQDNPRKLDELWRMADTLRRENVGDAVHLRGLIELSNHCSRSCWYCGIRGDNREVERYRMTEAEILECAAQAARFGYGTVVLQAGEDPGIRPEGLADLIRAIRSRSGLAVTLSLGERSDEELRLWREAGADRYLLRFETSNPELFERIHPSASHKRSDRVGILKTLGSLGYEVGSGVMIGIPGQTWDDLANDILLFADLDLDMIGVGPFLPHPATPLGQDMQKLLAPPGEQVPNTEDVTYKVIALARIVCPRANIPSTTALATLNRFNGREIGLTRGANIVMPNLTPMQYRALYEIYPAKACVQETAESCHHCLRRRILGIGRTIGTGRGDSPNRRFAGAAARKREGVA